MTEDTEENSGHPEADKGQQQSTDKTRVEKDPTKIQMDKRPAELISGLLDFIRSTLSLRDGAYDVPGILENVREGIVFKGYNVWILVCSIIIASVGLNMNSTAVIIGAMLISPLMGPIRGIGFGVGTNDFKLLTESLKNFGITVGISLAASYVYFLISPLHESTSELFGRTEPTFLDVMIAFFGGLAGVIALSKKKADTVIPGVAIATALMPPLCTAGYGLANGQWDYFLGAGYLFLLNSILIATSTYIFIRYLKFPKKEYLTPRIEKRVKIYTLAFIIVAIGPSIYMFYRITKISIFESNAGDFVEEVIMTTDDNIVVSPSYIFDWKNSCIELDISNYYADQNVIQRWERQMVNYDLKEVELRVQQGNDVLSDVRKMFDEYDQGNKGANTLAELLSKRENQLLMLQSEMEQLKEHPAMQPDPMEFDDLLSGFRVDYPEYDFIAIDRGITLDKKNELDTIYSLKVRFQNDVVDEDKADLNSKLSRRVKLELWQKKQVRQDSVYIYPIP